MKEGRIDMEERMEEKTIRISLETWVKLNQMRGINGCKKFEDVIKYLLNNEITKTERNREGIEKD